jgi:PAS domain S-box-containing protein
MSGSGVIRMPQLFSHALARLRAVAAMRHSVALALLWRVLLFSACLTLILTLLQLYINFRRAVWVLELRLEQIGESYPDSLAEGLWTLDEKQLRLQLTGILRLPDIRAVEVREAGTAPGRFVVRVGEKPDSSAIVREYPLRYRVQGRERVIGTVHVEATRAGIYQELLHSSFTILVSQAATIFLVSLFIVYIFHALVTRHLFAIASFVDSYRLHAPPSPLRLRRAPRDDELERVVTAFNALSDNLQTSYRRLQDANDQLRRSEFYLAEAQKLTHTGSWAWNPVTDAVLYWSEETFRIFGFDPQGGVPTTGVISQRIHPEDRENVSQTVRKLASDKTDFVMDYRIVLPDGRVKHIQLIGHPALNRTGEIIHYVGTVMDVTERKRAEEERERLRHREEELARINRVSMMGELAASLAHEIKQPIAAAVTDAGTCAGWLQRDPPDLAEARASAGRVVIAAMGAAEIIDRVRSLYTRGTPRHELVDINEVIHEMTSLLRDEACRHAVAIRCELGERVPRIRADRVQVQQVLLNLMLNGIEAMKETGGHLTIASQCMNGALLVSVVDSGVGVPAEHADRMFDAFFTTKPQGTGMGLSISRTIVKSHGGRLWATANARCGATFQFTLPAEETELVTAVESPPGA